VHISVVCCSRFSRLGGVLCFLEVRAGGNARDHRAAAVSCKSHGAISCGYCCYVLPVHEHAHSGVGLCTICR
jgi:hypothetical protein